ncbi:unnamed protein product [Natator depressus]
MTFPVNEQKRHFSKSHHERVLENGEKLNRHWLVYSKLTDKVICFCCKIFEKNAKSLLVLSRYNYWHNLADALKQHEKSPGHFTAYFKWMALESRLKLNKCIDAESQCIINVETKHWRDVLELLISISLFLAKNNLAFQSLLDKFFTEHNGNFLSLVELLGKYDNVMCEHLR